MITGNKNTKIFCLVDNLRNFFINHRPISYLTESAPPTNSTATSRISFCQSASEIFPPIWRFRGQDINLHKCEHLRHLCIMRKIFFILFYILLTVLPIQVKADDASAVAYEQWSYGHVKASTPNKQIALEKELMIVTEKNIQAIFIFRNTSNQYVETPCVFPISSDMRFEIETEGDSLFFRTYQGSPNFMAWAIALDERVHYSSDGSTTLSTTKDVVEAADKRLRKYTYTDYLKRVQKLTDTTYLTGCSIQQNGQNVPIMNVGIETTIIKNNQNIKESLYMDIFFYHFLKFKPNEVSKVVVEYPIESFEIEYDGCRSYKMVYDISSGGTWKNSIKSFMIYSTMDMESTSKSPENKKFGSCIFSDWKIYYKKDYKPIADDRFIFRSGDCTSFMRRASESTLKDRMDYYLKSDSIVKITYGRGELNPHAAFPKKLEPSPYVVNASSSTNKDVSSLFDGNLYTSYVTSKSSYVEFSLGKTVLGPFVSNGFVTNTFNEKVFYQKLDPQEEDYAFPIFKDSIWENTSRIKKIVLQRIGTSETDTFLLADKYGVLPCMRDDWKRVNAVHHPKILLPGNYRLSFIETYKGKKYSDAGVSEIWFYPYPEDLIAMVDEERKDSLRIFQDYYKNIEPDWVINYDFVPYDLLRSQEGSYYKECLKKYEDDSLRMQLDSLANYCEELRTNDTMEPDSTDIQNSGDGSSGSTDANGSYRYIILGAILLLLIAGGLVFFLRKKK